MTDRKFEAKVQTKNLCTTKGTLLVVFVKKSILILLAVLHHKLQLIKLIKETEIDFSSEYRIRGAFSEVPIFYGLFSYEKL